MFYSAQPHFSELNVQSYTCVKPPRPWRLNAAILLFLVGSLLSTLHFSVPFGQYPRLEKPRRDWKQMNSHLKFRVCPKHRSNWSIDTVSAPAGLLFAGRAPFSRRSAALQSCCSAGLRGLIKMQGLSNSVSQLSSASFALLLPPGVAPEKMVYFIRKECFSSFPSTSMVLLHVRLLQASVMQEETFPAANNPVPL